MPLFFLSGLDSLMDTGQWDIVALHNFPLYKLECFSLADFPDHKPQEKKIRTTLVVRSLYDLQKATPKWYLPAPFMEE